MGRVVEVKWTVLPCALTLVLLGPAHVATGEEESEDPQPRQEAQFRVDIEVNNTAALGDDLVEVTSAVPPRVYWVPARARVLPAPPQRVNVNLSNPDGRLGFAANNNPNTVPAPTLALTVGGNNNAWVPFFIAGAQGSQARRDARIVVANAADGAALGSHGMTVFWFDNPTLTIQPGGRYWIVRPATYTPNPLPAASYTGQATLMPPGMDRNQPVLRALRIGFILKL